MSYIDKISFLKKTFLDSAYVKDAEKGYIVVEPFNLALDPDILYLISSCWAEHYHTTTDISAIVGLPDAGSRLVSILANMLRIPNILPSKRTPTPPASWKDVVCFSNASFTLEQDAITSHIGFVKPGSKILLVDDVVAYGKTAVSAIKALQKADVEIIGLAVIFDKKWQGGVEKIVKETGVPVFSLMRIESISADRGIQLE